MVISLLDQTTISVVVFIMMWLICPFIFMRIISNFHMTRYHKKIEEFHLYWYITQVLSGRPCIEIKDLANPKKASAWDMKKRIKNGLSLKIRTESEARIEANKFFQNVAKPGSE